MSINKIYQFLVATILLCGTGVIISCSSDDSDSDGGSIAKPAVLKQGIWTEYDTVLVASGKYTMEQLAQMPTVGMWIKGDKGYFFTYTGEETSEPVEGQVSYDNTKGKGSITFPTITGNPLSGQTVNFKMTSDEMMEFELSYGGQTTTATFAWLCENFDNWSSDITDEDWLALMADYQLIPETAGPDASIDWSAPEVVTVQEVDDEGNIVEKEVTVTDLDEPLEWNDETAAARAGTRAIGIGTVVSAGLKVFSSLFEEDPNEKINAKLDAVLGKVDAVLANQQVMNAKLDKINGNLIAIAQKMKKQATVDIFNNRNEKFYNKLMVQNRKYFNRAYQFYNENKNNLSKEQVQTLGQYAKAWVGTDEKFADLTWQYIEYLTTVEHSDYGKGMDRIYDGLTFDKWPWEHLGTNDRESYRAYDLTMIAKCLFMISLYSTYGGLNDVEKGGLYDSYKDYKPQLKKFCEFTVANPDEFRVCQIPGAHFVMHKEIQKYNYYKNNKTPDLRYSEAAYRPEWHEAGSIKIDNPKELKEKLIRHAEAKAIHEYYESLYNKKDIWWYEMLVEGGEKPAGAVYSKKPSGVSNNKPGLLVYLHTRPQNNGFFHGASTSIQEIEWVWLNSSSSTRVTVGYTIGGLLSEYHWENYASENEYYAAIVEKRY